MSIQPHHLLERDWDQQRIPPLCPACGYNLHGLPELRCPECGCRPTAHELRQTAGETAARLRELDGIRANLRIGWTVGAAALAAGGALWIAGLQGLVILIGLLCGIGMVGCGLQSLRVRSLLREARKLASGRREVAEGLAMAAAGVLLVLLSALLL